MAADKVEEVVEPEETLHQSVLLKKVIEHLQHIWQSERGSPAAVQTLAQIEDALGRRRSLPPEVIELMTTCCRIRVIDSTRFVYAPIIDGIHSREDLVRILMNRTSYLGVDSRSLGGIKLVDLIDSGYEGISDDVAALWRDGEIIVLPYTDAAVKSNMIPYNGTRETAAGQQAFYYAPVAFQFQKHQEFKPSLREVPEMRQKLVDLFHSVPLPPDDTDLAAELQKAKLPSMVAERNRRRASTKQQKSSTTAKTKGPSRKRKLRKVTNDHMPELFVE